MGGFEDDRAKFMASEGLNATGANLTGFQSKLDAAYQDGLTKARAIGGDFGANKFGNEAASWYRQVSNAATEHSATQLKSATKNSLTSAAIASSNLVGSSPWNEDIWKDQVAAAQERQNTKGSLDQLPKDEIDLNTRREISTLALSRLTGAALSDRGTMASFNLLQQLKANNSLSDQDDIIKAENIVRQ